MKKSGKISINPEKVIKNNELVNLRGGYNEYECWCGLDAHYTFFAKADDCDGAMQWAISICGGDEIAGCPCS